MQLMGDRLNYFESLDYRDPGRFLSRLLVLSDEVAKSDLPPRVRNLRTNSLKTVREMRQAALFCYGMSFHIGTPVYVAIDEAQDHDAVAMWDLADGRHFRAFQLKEVVPSHLNPRASVQAVVDSLAKYADSKDICVAIYVNQRTRFEPASLQIAPLRVGEIWVFGSVSDDQSRWFMCGDLMSSEPVMIQFDHPPALDPGHWPEEPVE